jgi:hypothetical protein
MKLYLAVFRAFLLVTGSAIDLAILLRRRQHTRDYGGIPPQTVYSAIHREVTGISLLAEVLAKPDFVGMSTRDGSNSDMWEGLLEDRKLNS